MALGSLEDVRRLFIQAFMEKKNKMSDQEARILYQQVCQTLELEVNDVLSFDEFVNKMNQALQPLSMDIRKGYHPKDGAACWCLCNVLSDEATKTATDYSVGEIQFFKLLVDKMVYADNEAYQISSIEALKASSELKPSISKKDAEFFIDRLVQDEWFTNTNGILSLSIKSALELHPYLKEQYGDFILDCTICHDLALTDVDACVTRNCSTRLHYACRDRLFQHATTKKCPACSAEWVNGHQRRYHRTRPQESQD